LVDTAILISIFLVYLVLGARTKTVEPELEEGPVELLSKLPNLTRLFITILFFVFAGLSIYISAEPFSEGLLHIGAKTGIDKFILVQWIAPLASEAPELIVAIIFVLNLHPETSLRTVISSKINQWTLLVGMLPLVYNLSLGRIHPMILDFRQIEEILLTSAQSLFALVILTRLKFTSIDAVVLFVMFFTQLLIPSPMIRLIYAGVYIVLAILMILFRKNKQ
jgi:cation:H+ antiporter